MTAKRPVDTPPDDLEALPGLYAAALRLARAGTPPPQIADELEIPVESVAGLLILAEAKLTTLNRQAHSARHTERSTPEDGTTTVRSPRARTDNSTER